MSESTLNAAILGMATVKFSELATDTVDGDSDGTKIRANVDLDLDLGDGDGQPRFSDDQDLQRQLQQLQAIVKRAKQKPKPRDKSCRKLLAVMKLAWHSNLGLTDTTEFREAFVQAFKDAKKELARLKGGEFVEERNRQKFSINIFPGVSLTTDEIRTVTLPFAHAPPEKDLINGVINGKVYSVRRLPDPNFGSPLMPTPRLLRIARQFAVMYEMDICEVDNE